MYNLIHIVIPACNERENIKTTLSEIRDKVRTPCHVTIVYDFDEDSTLPAVEEWMRTNWEVFLLKNKYGKGAANAIKTGFEMVDGDVILVTMADLSDDLAKVDVMFKRVNEGYDIVCGSRYMKGGEQQGGPWLKKLLSRTAGVSLHVLTGLPTHDVTNSFKMYTKKVLNNIKIESGSGFELGMEIVIKAHFSGFKVTEIPCTWVDRRQGESRFKILRWMPKYLRWYFYGLRKFLLH
jgi:glycosyltransferase involved in cell wall biosynthesis